jgi:hypothetical protein
MTVRKYGLAFGWKRRRENLCDEPYNDKEPRLFIGCMRVMEYSR